MIITTDMCHMSTTNLKPCSTNNTYKFITVLFKEILQI